MEDIRKLLNDDEAAIALESLAYILRGLNAAIAEETGDGMPSDRAERLRHQEIVGALTRCAELHSAALARRMSGHLDECLKREE